MVETEVKLKVKNLFAKAVNHGMTPKEAYRFFQNSIREVRGKKKKK